MAMSSQFSLSVELTKLVPFGPLATLAGKGLVELLREVQGSGSDLVTEEDLSMIFGRNRIEPQFERTFRTAVRKSVIHQVQDIAELVLEAGAGPTVRRSLKEPVFFSTVVQLSLLTWSHEITSLARSLAQALERRARQQETYKTPPRYDALKGTLRACREQTSGFMWELILAAVANQVRDIVDVSDWYEGRSMPMAILQSLLDGLTAVQHLPENAFLRISSSTGIPTIVTWAHHLLGLTVTVASSKGVVRFGQGRESMYINADESVNGQRVVESASLFNETNDVLFKVSVSSEDVPLNSASRHSIFGYGSRSIEIKFRDSRELIGGLAHVIITSCIHLADEEWAKSSHDPDIGWRGRTIIPSHDRILKISNLLFPGYEDVLEEIRNTRHFPCLLRSDWLGPDTLQLFPESVKWYSENMGQVLGHFKLISHQLALLLLILSMVEGVESCSALPLELSFIPKDRCLPIRLPDATEALETLRLLLKGRDVIEFANDADARASVISVWGWSLCMGSLTADDPSRLAPGLVVCQGVPMREGERRRLILDGFPRPVDFEEPDKRLKRHEEVAGPGDSITLSSWTKQEKTRYFIAVTDIAFEVAKVYVCRSLRDETEVNQLRIGFRNMQEAYWRTVHIPACEHPVKTNHTATLRPSMWAFHGFGPHEANGIGPPESNRMHGKEGSIHVAVVAGDNAARWTLAMNKFYLFLRDPDCCLDCALEIASDNRRGRHLGLVL